MSAKNKPQHECPVCGYAEMEFPPESGEICPSCGTQFDSEGFEAHRYPELRRQWISKGLAWFSRGELAPKNWNPYRQLIIANHEADLVSNERINHDLEYRYAVDEAFADVRIAIQLRAGRENQHPALTQTQLADKAEMKQSRISELEGMNYSSWSVSTLRRLAKALGVHFVFAFKTWEELAPEIGRDLERAFKSLPAEHAVSAEQEKAISAALVSAIFRKGNVTRIDQFVRLPRQASQNPSSIHERQVRMVAAGGR